MNETINREGLARLVNFELKRLNFSNRADAARVINGRIGVYDTNGQTINAELDNYFSNCAVKLTSH